MGHPGLLQVDEDRAVEATPVKAEPSADAADGATEAVTADASEKKKKKKVGLSTALADVQRKYVWSSLGDMRGPICTNTSSTIPHSMNVLGCAAHRDFHVYVPLPGSGLLRVHSVPHHLISTPNMQGMAICSLDPLSKFYWQDCIGGY